MYIRDLAARTGFSPDTIRFYEKLNLLTGNRQHRQGHRQYDESHVATLLQIKFAKAMGFSLKDLQRMLTDWQTGRLTNADKRVILVNQLRQMNEAMAELAQVQAHLEAKLARFDDFDCSTAGLPGQQPSTGAQSSPNSLGAKRRKAAETGV